MMNSPTPTHSEGHTPGPWFASRESVYRNQYQNGQIADCDVGSRPLAERKANARLIAAAPELLKACAAWIAYLASDEPGNSDQEGELLDAMKAAISQATSPASTEGR